MAIVLNAVSEKEFQPIRIRADEPGPLVDIPEVLRYRDLLWTLAERDLRVRYKQTALGVVWVVLQPLMAALIFAFVFGVIAKLPSDGRPYILFAFAGMTAWNLFAGVLNKVSNSLLSNAQMLTKIYFPKLILPLSATVSGLVDSSFSQALMVLMLVLYRVWPGWGIVLLPVWLAILAVMALGVGLMATSFMVRYRDVGHIIPVALQLGLYISPVAWSMTNVPEKYRWILWCNPLSSLMQAIRWSWLSDGTLPLPALAYSIAAATAVFWLGLLAFKQQERASPMSSKDLAVSVRGLSKSYIIAHNSERPTNLREVIVDRLRHPIGNGRQKRENSGQSRTVDFDIRRGESVGIIGRNGAGKSTLLKLLSRITYPTAGAIDLYGPDGEPAGSGDWISRRADRAREHLSQRFHSRNEAPRDRSQV